MNMTIALSSLRINQDGKFGRLLNLLTEYPVIVVDNGHTGNDGVGRATLLSQFKNLGYGAT